MAYMNTGPYNFKGNYNSPTHSAHPKVLYYQGEYMTYGYEAKGDASTDICYSAFDLHGNKLEECWLNAPYSGRNYQVECFGF